VAPHVLVIGGGFGGLEVAKGLRASAVDVTIVDRENHHLFQPLLYQVATAGLAPSDIAQPIRALLSRQKNVEFRLAEVRSVDSKHKRVRILADDGGEAWMSYDTLVVAAGTSHSYFGHEEWERHAPGLKTLGDALEIRRRVLSAFERAEWADDAAEKRALTTFVIVGGGPTGVELAGAIAEIACRTLRRDFRRVDTARAHIVLVEAGPTILSAYHPDLQKRAIEQLMDLDVHVRLNSPVTHVDGDGVVLGDGERILAGTVLWAAGVSASPLARSLGAQLDGAGRVQVAPDLTVPGRPDVFVVGDLASVSAPDGRPVPGVAPAALQMGRFVARQIRRDLAGAPREAFAYFDKGSMATIGRTKAVFESGAIRLSGFLAWLLWVVVHIWFLVSLRHRLLVMLRWAWAWFGYHQSVRLIWHPSTAIVARPSDAKLVDVTGPAAPGPFDVTGPAAPGPFDVTGPAAPGPLAKGAGIAATR
jgi:NADH dehydrogenase